MESSSSRPTILRAKSFATNSARRERRASKNSIGLNMPIVDFTAFQSIFEPGWAAGVEYVITSYLSALGD